MHLEAMEALEAVMRQIHVHCENLRPMWNVGEGKEEKEGRIVLH